MKCIECESECENENEDGMCCACACLNYDEKCMECRQREMETLSDYAVDKYKDDMMDRAGL